MNDTLDDLFNHAAAATGNPPAARVTPPATFKPAVERAFTEFCGKCHGSGNWRPGYPCFGCGGTGRKTFKTSAAERARGREQAAERKARNADESFADFKAREPQVFAWLQAEASKTVPFEFAVSMLDAIAKWGDLTEKQLDASRRLTAKAAERHEHSVRRVADAPQVSAKGIDRLKTAFDTAIAYHAAKGLKLSPKLTIGNLTIKPAKANSANPGALYVTDGDTYIGKIKGGRFFAAHGCTDEQEARVLAFVADPKAAAEVYGQTTGTCCVCNATLRSEWKYRGIGPICAEKFGW